MYNMQDVTANTLLCSGRRGASTFRSAKSDLIETRKHETFYLVLFCFALSVSL